MSRCIICDYCDDTDLSMSSTLEAPGGHNIVFADDEFDEPICRRCRSEVAAYTWDSNLELELSEASNIEAMITELQHRIPGLFDYPMCPWTGGCQCTYDSGCRLLTKDNDNGIIKVKVQASECVEEQ